MLNYNKSNSLKRVIYLLLTKGNGEVMETNYNQKLAEEYILEAKIKGERLIAISRLIMIIPLLGMSVALLIQEIFEKGFERGIGYFVFWLEVAFIFLAVLVSLDTLRRMKAKRYANWMPYLLPLFDISLIAVVVFFVSTPLSGLMFCGAAPWLFLIFISLGTLRNSPRSVILTGALSAAILLTFSLISMDALNLLAPTAGADTFVHKLSGMPIRITLDDVIIKPIIVLLVTFVCAYLAVRFNRMVQEQVDIRVKQDSLRMTLTTEIKTVTQAITDSSLSLVSMSQQFVKAIGHIASMASGIEGAIKEESDAIESTGATITQMIQSIAAVAQSIGRQAELVNSSASAIEEIGASIKQITATSQNATQLAKSLLGHAEHGEQAMEDVAQAIQEAEESSRQIEEIVEIISAIANETDLLAMNAAIEAAHAGEAGKGFAVVADEIRNLAENSASNAKMINDILKDLSSRIAKIADEVKNAVATFSAILKDARHTSQINQEILKAMEEETSAVNEIVATTQSLSQITTEVKNASAEQAAGGEEIIAAVTKIRLQTASVSQLIKDQDQKSQEIFAVTKELRTIVDKNQQIIVRLNEVVKSL